MATGNRQQAAGRQAMRNKVQGNTYYLFLPPFPAFTLFNPAHPPIL
jgi:hypothetical protein